MFILLKNAMYDSEIRLNLTTARNKLAKRDLLRVKFYLERGEFVLQRQRQLLCVAKEAKRQILHSLFSRRKAPIFKKFL